MNITFINSTHTLIYIKQKKFIKQIKRITKSGRNNKFKFYITSPRLTCVNKFYSSLLVKNIHKKTNTQTLADKYN